MSLPIAADKGEAGAEFHEELAQVLQEATVDVAFAGVFGQAEEVEVVGVFQERHGELGLRRGQRALEVGGGGALAAVEVAVDLVVEDGAAPAVLDGGLGVPFAFGGVFYSIKEESILTPRN